MPSGILERGAEIIISTLATMCIISEHKNHLQNAMCIICEHTKFHFKHILITIKNNFLTTGNLLCNQLQ